MFPSGMGGMNPRQMKQAMKRLGINQAEIDAKEVIIRLSDKEILISNPSVSKINMMGQETFQIVGEISERALTAAVEVDTTPEISEEDVKTIMEQAKVSEQVARKELEKTKGDIAEAIMNLTENE